ncbi:SprT family zinc-dependent metalloprotease [Melaminivora sp.]
MLRHPQANQQLQLPGAQVAYRLQRARRRSIGFRVDGDGLSVRAPLTASLQAIEQALHTKADWITRKLAEQQDWQRRQQDTRITWGDAALLPYLGQPLRLRLDPARTVARAGAQPGTDAEGCATLHLPLASSASAAQVRDATHAWLLRQAQAYFTARLEHFAPQLGVRWTRLVLSGARTRWGSASADGTIRLNWRLMHSSPEVIDYVVVHELAHLRVMDHSPRFWDTVASVMPEWPLLRQRLHDSPMPQWD